MIIVTNVTGKTAAESLRMLWGDSHDMRHYSTKVEEDVWGFVRELLDHLSDEEADLILLDKLTARHTPEEWARIREELAD